MHVLRHCYLADNPYWFTKALDFISACNIPNFSRAIATSSNNVVSVVAYVNTIYFPCVTRKYHTLFTGHDIPNNSGFVATSGNDHITFEVYRVDNVFMPDKF